MKRTETSLWNFVPLDKFSKPAEPVSETARSWLKILWERVRRSSSPAVPVDVQVELRSVPQDLLDTVAPTPNWNEAAVALDLALKPWFHAEEPDHFTQTIIGPPGSGTRQILVFWGKEKNGLIMDAPDFNQLLRGGEDWLPPLAGNEKGPLIIPCLERFYLRHHNGFLLLRKLLDWLWKFRPRCLIGCNSLAWAYLSETLKIDSVFPSPYVLEAFDATRLQQWLRMLALHSGRDSLIFRQVDDGCYILPSDEDSSGDQICEEKEGAGKGDSYFLRRLAARSRGIPLIAWATWRHSLNIAMDQGVEEKARKAAVEDGGQTIWVRPWSQLDLPRIPQGVSHPETFLLHAILLHDGLPEEILPHLLPFSANEIKKNLLRLSTAGLLKEEEGMWRVTLLGYPAVRQYLGDEDYLVDPL
jgi:hypothetical protein